jgi:hypothetical protein
VVKAGRFGRGLLIAAPFLLIGVGGWCLFRSPWPTLLHLVLTGQHVLVVRPTWTTVGLPAATVVSWGVAIWLSLIIKPQRS